MCHLYVLACWWVQLFMLKWSFFLLESCLFVYLFVCLFIVPVCINTEEGLS